ncbi:MAG: CsbD family protein [Acidobacteriota bacterium]
MWNEDEIEGKGKQVKGAIKDKAGDLLNDRDLEAEGKAERLEGKVQEKIGEVRRNAGDALEKAGKAISGK